MRADRLLSILLMLQRRGRMTAGQLAAELEVSERTIYRDMDALGMAGVPVYGDPGPDGGYALLGGFRTALTGLNEHEMEALFMLNVPPALTDLGLSQSLKSALLKVFSSLPPGGDEHERWIQRRFLMDSVPWPHRIEPITHLPTIQQAVWQDRRLLLHYRIGPLDRDIEQVVDPYSLVAKAGDWYLVYAVKGHTRAIRISQVRGVTVLDEGFDRAGDFDLAAFWDRWRAAQETGAAAYTVTMRVALAALPEMQQRYGERVARAFQEAGETDRAGWRTIELTFDSLAHARRHLLAFGGAVEVLSPQALRTSLRDHADQIVARYEKVESVK